MDSDGNYWLKRGRFSRRSMLRAAGAGGLGLAAASLIACGGSESNTATSAPSTSTSTSAPSATATSTGTATSASGANATSFVAPTVTPGANTNGTLVWGMESGTDPLDPTTVFAWVTWRIIYQMFEALVTRDLLTEDENPLIVPRLAKSWEIPDDLTYIFHLQEGVKFHDGTPFDSAAAKFNYDRVNEADTQYYFPLANTLAMRYVYQHTDHAETPDAATITYKNTQPFWDFIEIQSAFFFPGQISPKAVQDYGNDSIGQEHPVGTGPYRFVENVQGQHITIERNPDYWGSPANLAKIIYKPIPDNAARVTSLQTGESDIIVVPPVDSLEQLKSGGFDIKMGPTPHVWYMYLNLNPDDKLMNDIRVRQALQMAINKDGISHDLMKDTVFPAHQFHTPGAPAFDPNFKLYNYDPQQAKQLLSAAGYADGVSTKWEFAAGGSGNLEPQAIAEWMQRDLKDIGFNIEMGFTEWITYLSNTLSVYPQNPQETAWQMSWGMSQNYFLNPLAHSKWITPDFPNFYYKNANFDSTLDKAEQEKDPVQRNQLYRDANRILMEDAVLVPIVHDKAPIAISPRVHGFIHAAEECYDTRSIWVDA